MEKLVLNNISKSFDDKLILNNINLSLKSGQIIALVGKSGGGKTTLFNIIAGLLPPDTGDVLLDGESIANKPGRISYMLQKDLLLAHKTIVDNIALPLIIQGVPKNKAREQAMAHFDKFGLTGYEKKHPSELSGGMRQRAALLRTYLFSGDVALLDEPFSALDTITRGQMHEWYLSVMEDLKLSTILITHDIDEAILLCDQIFVLGATDDGSTITHTITIENRQSKSPDYLLTEQFLEYKKQLIKWL